MTREELEHIIRGSAQVTQEYEFVIVGSQVASKARMALSSIGILATIRRWAKATAGES